MATSQHNLPLLRAVPDPIAWYVRVGFNDHKMMENRLSAGDTRINRVVIDAAYLERHAALINALQSRQAEMVLDPRVAELTMPAGEKKSLQSLDWADAANEPDPDRYDAERVDEIASSIATVVIEQGCSAVLAPAHYLSDSDDAWIDIDVALTKALRDALDKRGGRRLRVYYPLLLPYSWLTSSDRMIPLAGVLSTMPINAVWLRVSNFQNDKSAAAVRNYIEGARTLLSADRPLIADHVGGFSGLAILAFGAAGGIAHGIGVREGFKVANWRRRPGQGFGAGARTYVAGADLYLSKSVIEPLLDDPVVRSKVGCTNKHCCPRGVEDMFTNSKIHLINSRYDQLAAISSSLESRRAGDFIRRMLISAGSQLMNLDHALSSYPDVQMRVQRKRRFVDDLRYTLESLASETSVSSRRSSIPRRIPVRPLAVSNDNNTRPSL